MCLDQRPRRRRDFGLSVEELSRMAKVAGLLGVERIRHLLKYNPHGNRGGTVEPPRDFQKESFKSPVDKGVPP